MFFYKVNAFLLSVLFLLSSCSVVFKKNASDSSISKPNVQISCSTINLLDGCTCTEAVNGPQVSCTGVTCQEAMQNMSIEECSCDDTSGEAVIICTPPALPQVATPVFTPAPDTYEGPQNITVNTGTEDATIHYTLDGNTPDCLTPASISNGDTVVIDSSKTLKAIACKNAMTPSELNSGSYIIQAVEDVINPPTFNPVNSLFTGSISISLESDRADANIFYNINKTEKPTCSVTGFLQADNSIKFTGAFVVSANAKIQAIACVASGSSLVSVKTYTKLVPPSNPVISPSSTTFNTSSLKISISSSEGSEIYYTLDHTNPTCASIGGVGSSSAIHYDHSFFIYTSARVKAIACKDGLSSTIESETYTQRLIGDNDVVITIDDPLNPESVSPPIFYPDDGTYYSPLSVVLSHYTLGTKIHYTLDNSTPTCSSPLYSEPIIITSPGVNVTKTVKAIACNNGHFSGVKNKTYTVTQQELIYNYDGTTTAVAAGFTNTFELQTSAPWNQTSSSDSNLTIYSGSAKNFIGNTANKDYLVLYKSASDPLKVSMMLFRSTGLGLNKIEGNGVLAISEASVPEVVNAAYLYDDEKAYPLVTWDKGDQPGALCSIAKVSDGNNLNWLGTQDLTPSWNEHSVLRSSVSYSDLITNNNQFLPTESIAYLYKTTSSNGKLYGFKPNIDINYGFFNPGTSQVRTSNTVCLSTETYKGLVSGQFYDDESDTFNYGDMAVFCKTSQGNTKINLWSGKLKDLGDGQSEKFTEVGVAWSGTLSADSLAKVVSGDFNADGVSDVAAVQAVDSNKTKILVWLGQKNTSGKRLGQFNNPIIWWSSDNYMSSDLYGVSSGDLNGDGHDDIVALRRTATGYQTQAWLSN